MRKGCTLILKKSWPKHTCTNSLREKRMSILASCIINLSELHIVFSSSVLIRLSKDAFEEHLCQTVNNIEPHVSFEKEVAIPTHQAYQKHYSILYTYF